MKPTTVFQKKVSVVQPKIKPLTEDQKEWGKKNVFGANGLLTKHTVACLECGHKWKVKGVLLTKLAGCDCPNCKADLEIVDTKSRTIEERDYMAIFETVEGIQVVRMIHFIKRSKAGHVPTWEIREVMQHFISNKGKEVVYSCPVNAMTGYYDSWASSAKLEMRDNKGFGVIDRGGLLPEKIYPKKKLIPEIKRNGFTGDFLGLSPKNFFIQILSDSRVETMLKAKQFGILKYYFKNAVGGRYSSKQDLKHWNSIKICIRKNYFPKDVSNWFDYLDMMEYFNRDLLNPHYVCPVDLKKEHDKYVKKRSEARRKEQRKYA